jgi:pimeloyl-ACP methyl ester carboxylesterase
VPALRAGPRYAPPLYVAAQPASKARAAWRSFPPPPRCAEVAAPIVFLPALALTSAEWDAVAERLGACRARVLADLPGIGESPRGALDEESVLQAIDDLVQAESPGAPAILVGSSLGGALAARLAARRPDRVAALVLVDAPAAPFPRKFWERVVRHPVAWGPLFRLVAPSAATRIGLGLFVGPHPDPAVVASIARELDDATQRSALTAYDRAFLDPARVDATARALASVRAPVLVLWGAADRVVPAAVASAIAARLPAGATVSVLPGAGHLPPLDAPVEVAHAIDAFVASLPSAPAPPPLRDRALAPQPLRPGTLLHGARDEWFPLVGAQLVGSLDSRLDVGLHAGIARGSTDRHYPLETGRLVWTAGFALHSDPINPQTWSFGYLRTTLRLELVWRWGGGFHLDGTLLVDPTPGRFDRVGGWGALGYTPSVVPWVRGFVAYGRLPETGDGRVLFGVEIDARVTGLMY